MSFITSDGYATASHINVDQLWLVGWKVLIFGVAFDQRQGTRRNNSYTMHETGISYLTEVSFITGRTQKRLNTRRAKLNDS